jgi:hypothetical protein
MQRGTPTTSLGDKAPCVRRPTSSSRGYLHVRLDAVHRGRGLNLVELDHALRKLRLSGMADDAPNALLTM